MESSVFEQGRSFGFRLADEFIEQEEERTKDPGVAPYSFSAYKAYLLNSDLRRQPCLAPYFPASLAATQASERLSGIAVLQVVSITNISVPSKRKFDDTSSRVLAIVLTDGHTKVTGIEMERLDDIHANTPPGGKVHFSGGAVVKGKLLLTNTNTRYLGGEVAFLLEAHKANITALRFRAITGKGGKSTSSVSALGPVPPRFDLKLAAPTPSAPAAVAKSASKPLIAAPSQAGADAQQTTHRGRRKPQITTAPSVPTDPAYPAAGYGGQTKKHLDERGGRGGRGKQRDPDVAPSPPELETAQALSPQAEPAVDDRAALNDSNKKNLRPQKGNSSGVRGKQREPVAPAAASTDSTQSPQPPQGPASQPARVEAAPGDSGAQCVDRRGKGKAVPNSALPVLTQAMLDLAVQRTDGTASEAPAMNKSHRDNQRERGRGRGSSGKGSRSANQSDHPPGPPTSEAARPPPIPHGAALEAEVTAEGSKVSRNATQRPPQRARGRGMTRGSAPNIEVPAAESGSQGSVPRLDAAHARNLIASSLSVTGRDRGRGRTRTVTEVPPVFTPLVVPQL